ncbi:MAG: shikimate kinase [bacterium]|nr:shikimate kinase [bacterium]
MSRDTEKQHIWLVGFSGSGKSTIGPALAKLLHMQFVDTDEVIERQSRTKIAHLFAKRGEVHFRTLESTLIQRIAGTSRPTVVALGGGAFQSAVNRKIIRTSGISIYLKSSVSVIYRRLAEKSDRPLLEVVARSGETLKQARIARIANLLANREHNYLRADITVSSSKGTPAEIARRIRKRIGKLNG